MLLATNLAQLLDSPAVYRINFHCGPTRVWGEGFRTIARAIRRYKDDPHRVEVDVRPELASVGCGRYRHNHGRSQGNKLSLPFSSMQTVQDRALALHEATHALQDWCAHPMKLDDSECAAYIAQMMYLHITTGRFAMELEGELYMDAFDVFQASYRVAVRLLGESGGYFVTQAERREINTAVRRLAPYRDGDQRMVWYNGL